jgi:hypothetical protein
MTFYSDDVIDIEYVRITNCWVLILNGLAVRDAKREQALRNYVKQNSVLWERPFNG